MSLFIKTNKAAERQQIFDFDLKVLLVMLKSVPSNRYYISGARFLAMLHTESKIS